MSFAMAMLMAGGFSITYSVGNGGSLLDSDDVTFSGQSSVTITFLSNGGATFTAENFGSIASFAWITPSGLAPGSYTIRLDVDSGTSPTGANTGQDLALTSNRSWTWTRNTSGETTANITLTLKDGGGNTVATAQYLVSVEVN